MAIVPDCSPNVYVSLCVNAVDARGNVIVMLSPNCASDGNCGVVARGMLSRTADPLQDVEVRDDGGKLPDALITTVLEPSLLCGIFALCDIASTQSEPIDNCFPLTDPVYPPILMEKVPVPAVVYPVFVRR